VVERIGHRRAVECEERPVIAFERKQFAVPVEQVANDWKHTRSEHDERLTSPRKVGFFKAFSFVLP
jgi:hypothetical protein